MSETKRKPRELPSCFADLGKGMVVGCSVRTRRKRLRHSGEGDLECCMGNRGNGVRDRLTV